MDDRQNETVAAIIGTIVGIGVALAALTPWAWVLAHHEALRNLALVAAGAFAVPLAIWRAWVAQRQAETARRSLLNERDQKAAEMLGSTLLSVRLGGIYALQTLAAEHPPHYHLGVMRQFCAFVRWPQNPTLTDGSPPAGTAPRPIPKMPDSAARLDNHARREAAAGDAASELVREDVHAVMDAIAARSDAGIQVEQQEKRFRLDLSNANLRGWRFSGADLSGADLLGANLSGVILLEANLGGANLGGANLSGANLSGANLSGANLSGANLSRANLSRVILVGADLFVANFSEANLCGANLSGLLLWKTDFSGADLSGANLSRVRVMGDNFEVDLSGANLCGADFSGADLSGVNLSTARLSAATVITQEQLNKTVAKAEMSPIIKGVVRDAKTKDLLKWRQQGSTEVIRALMDAKARRASS